MISKQITEARLLSGAIVLAVRQEPKTRIDDGKEQVVVFVIHHEHGICSINRNNVV